MHIYIYIYSPLCRSELIDPCVGCHRRWTRKCINKDELGGIPCLTSLSPYKHAILEYIGGYIVRKLAKKVSCETCYQAMMTSDGNVTQHGLILSKDRGSLINDISFQ